MWFKVLQRSSLTTKEVYNVDYLLSGTIILIYSDVFSSLNEYSGRISLNRNEPVNLNESVPNEKNLAQSERNLSSVNR